jgi:hypothetical protein
MQCTSLVKVFRARPCPVRIGSFKVLFAIKMVAALLGEGKENAARQI